MTDLREALEQALSALSYTYMTVEDGKRPHWCRYQPPLAANGHERMCAAMLMTQDQARAALKATPEWDLLAAMLRDELRRVQAGVATPRSTQRAIDAYERAVRPKNLNASAAFVAPEVEEPECGALHPTRPAACRLPKAHDGDHATARGDVTWPVDPAAAADAALDPLRARVRPIVAKWFDTGYESGKLSADELTDQVVDALVDPVPVG